MNRQVPEDRHPEYARRFDQPTRRSHVDWPISLRASDKPRERDIEGDDNNTKGEGWNAHTKSDVASRRGPNDSSDHENVRANSQLRGNTRNEEGQ
jgi:hypothetical protein